MAALIAIVTGLLVRQIDRWWFSDLRSGLWPSARHRPATINDVLALQRERRNDVTPVLLVAGHWLELAGYVLLIRLWPGVAVAAAVAVLLAVKCRHLQETSHFGVHTALARSRRLGDALTEYAMQGPLALATVDTRRTTHVRRHHPNANVPGIDPNLADLRDAGMYPGCSRASFVLATVYPLTPRGLLSTLRTIARNLRPGPGTRWRVVMPTAATALVVAAAGPLGLAALLVGRLLVYPQLAWCSLLVEHRWFSATSTRGRPVQVEAGRCVRVLSRSRVAQSVARVTWLPYGDLFHFAHSAYPTIRWNYLPNVERMIGLPEFTPHRLVRGHDSVLGALRRTLDSDMPSPDPAAEPRIMEAV